MDNEKLRRKELADFLKSRRARLSPEEMGLKTATRRRTPGLRREELAQAAGIGVTWYTWLEQGRPIQVSAQVVESLSRVLGLDPQERIHLFRLANQPIPAVAPECRERISPALQQVLDRLEGCPALITDPHWTVVAWNTAARALFGDFETMAALDRNIVWAMFTDPRYREMFPEWERHAKGLLGRFRAAWGFYLSDPWPHQLAEALLRQSEEFRRWWPLHEILPSSEKDKRLAFPEIGTLDFEVTSFDVADNSGLKMIVHTPVPHTGTEAAMLRLMAARGLPVRPATPLNEGAP